MEIATKKNAKKYCSIYRVDGNCAGWMMSVDKETSKLTIHIDKKFAEKPCQVEKGCEFFESTVVPSIKG